MITLNQQKFDVFLEAYKENFTINFPNEKYKWIAVKHFQENWNIEAKDFENMLREATSKTKNLLSSYNKYPLVTIFDFCKINVEKVRSMYNDLFDENRDLFGRIDAFNESADLLLEEAKQKKVIKENGHHFQDLNIISIYLSLIYPTKYFIYKYGECKDGAERLGSNLQIKTGIREETINSSFEFFKLIAEKLKSDVDFVNLYKNTLDLECYNDPEMHLATTDFIFFINNYYPDLMKENSEELQDDRGEGYETSTGEDSAEQNTIEQEDLEQREYYSEEDFLSEVFMSEEDMKALKYILENKKNIILQGAPGVGKTFSAKRLAYMMMGLKDEGKICMVQFHQSYSYEDFVLGYKPVKDGFELQKGKFYNFCLEAAKDPGNKYFFIIDEINRGNLSKIFGELLMTIEASYRGTKIRLAYGDEEFSIPENLYIIGMLNTADRSLALIDYALRRRFSFFSMEPGFDTEGFKRIISEVDNPAFEKLVDKVKELNVAISNDASLGKGFQIGHSYFCKSGTSDDFNLELDKTNRSNKVDFMWLESVVKYDIIPMLEEYWFDNEEEVETWRNRLLNSIR